MDATAPDLAGQSVDLVVSSLVLLFLPGPVIASRAWLDLLVPGHSLGFHDVGSQDDT